MTEDEEILQGLDLLGDWLDAKGYTEEAGLCTRAMDKINLLKAIASKAIREQIPLGDEIKSLRAENEKLRERLEKAHSFISRADWMQFFEEEHDAAAALKEPGDE